MPRGSYIKSFLTTSVTQATGGASSSAMNVPLMAAGIMPRGQAAGIQIWSIEFEISLLTWMAADLTVSVMLSTVAITAEKYVNDRDILFKWKIHTECAAASAMPPQPLVYDKDFYPAIPFYGQQLHFGIRNDSGVTLTVYCKVWYSLITMSQNEVLAQLQNQLT